jgi:hypothetical protein
MGELEDVPAHFQLYADRRADRARNEAIGVLGFVVLIVGLITALGLNTLLRGYADNSVSEITKKYAEGSYLLQAKAAADEIEKIRVRYTSTGGTGEVVASYSDGVHISVPQSVHCPNGHYVAGIDVHYGGSCRNQCDKDGGIIRWIELKCRPLPPTVEDQRGKMTDR